ncbi:MAG: lytic murein transglycosylase B, partial [Gammaproteobacteria bacterium]
MSHRILRFAASSALALLTFSTQAYDPPTPVQVSAAEKKFAADLERDSDLSASDVLATLAKAHYQQSIIDAITRPAESKSWREYRPIFLTEKRIGDGVEFATANATLLKRVEKETGVPATLVTAIIGV